MRKLITLIVLVVAAGSWLAFRPSATTDASDLEGVWKIVHVTVTSDEGTVEEDINQPNLTIFSGSHYASVFPILGAPGESIAQAGTYEVKGNEIHLRAIVATSPNVPEEFSGTFELDGDTLVVTWTDGSVVTSTRVE